MLNKNHILRIPIHKGYRFIREEDIIFCEAHINYTYLHLHEEDEAVLVSKTLKKIEEVLSYDLFFRVNRKYLINIFHIKEYSRNKKDKIILINGQEFHLARRRKSAFLKMLSTV